MRKARVRVPACEGVMREGAQAEGPETVRTPSGARKQLPLSPQSRRATGERGIAMRETRGRSKKVPVFLVFLSQDRKMNTFSRRKMRRFEIKDLSLRSIKHTIPFSRRSAAST